jgi:hypothetical protein
MRRYRLLIAGNPAQAKDALVVRAASLVGVVRAMEVTESIPTGQTYLTAVFDLDDDKNAGPFLAAWAYHTPDHSPYPVGALLHQKLVRPPRR